MSDYQGLYLPKLFENANVGKPSENGRWETKDKRLIADLAKGIDIGERPSTSNISSIPDVYARPLLFQSAFGNAHHPLHRRVVQEWRGLLSLLALHGVKAGLQLTFTPVRLDFGGTLATAMQQLAPPPVRLQTVPAPRYEWTDLLLIQLDGKTKSDNKITLGSLSPTTLVFTAAEYDLRPSTFSGPFRDDEGYLRPPQAIKDREDLEGVGEWVKWLYNELRQLLNAGSGAESREQEVIRVLYKELEAWREDIKAELGNSDLDSPQYIHGNPDSLDGTPGDVVRVTGADFLDSRDVYRRLLTPLKPDPSAAAISESDCALALDQRRSAEFQHVVVIHRDLGKNLRVWKNIKFEDLGANPIETLFRQSSGRYIDNHDIGKDHALWIRPELYFLTTTLTKASGPSSFLPTTEARANGNSSRFLLPLKPEILQFFTVEEITDKLRPHYSEDGDRVVFSLRLPLSNGRSLKIEKNYLAKGANQAAGEGVLVERAVPVLELFPNYLGEFWARYYLLSSDTEKLLAQPIHGGPRQLFYQTKQQQADSSTERLRAEITCISGADCFPEAVALIERGTKEAVGLVLLEKYNGHEEGDLRPGSAFSGSAVFGIDFGTSNTNVFIKRGRGEEATAEALKLRFSKLLRPLTASPSKLRADTTQAFFLPTQDLTLPTPTALRVYNSGVRENLLLDYFIFFPDRPRYPENVLVDLKWEQESRDSLNNFLESLCFLLVVEAVRQRIGTIEFRCTYPKSFTPARAKEYQDKWNWALRSIFDTEGTLATQPQSHKLLYGETSKWPSSRDYVALKTDAGLFSVDRKTFFATEGIAAGEFFSNKITAGIDRASPETGAICIDVGGGTTDFSILYKGVIKYDASVLLAGRQIAELMAHNGRIGQTLLSPDANEALQQAQAAPNKFASRMNFILRAEHKAISAALARESGSDAIRPLRRVLMVEFGALAFYAGHLTLALNRFLKGDLSEKVAMSGLKLHWGGNASKMLDWIDSGHFEADGNGAAKLLNNLFGGVVTSKDVPESDRIALRGSLLGQVQSKGQKNEAAGGVVVMSTVVKKMAAVADEDDGFDVPDDEPQTNQDFLEGVVMGERVTFGGKSYEPYHVFTAKDVFDQNGSLYTDTNLEQLDQFLKVLNHLGVKYGGLDPGEIIELSAQDRLKIRNNLRTDFATQANKEPDERTLEPVFIMEVRYLLDIMQNQMRL